MDFNEFYRNKLGKDKKLQKISQDKERRFLFEVAHLITAARLHAGLTQDQLAKKMKTNQPSIARLERGSNLPTLSFLLKIAKALNTYLIPPAFGFMDQRVETRNIGIHVSSYTVTDHKHASWTIHSSDVKNDAQLIKAR
jgi:transcriptional regulator with XRE-family HTH domain